MKFRAIKRFAGKGIEDLLTWTINELSVVLRELFIGITNLSFNDNFLGFEWEGTIAPTAQAQIVHNLKSAPTRFLVTSAGGTSLIVKGTTEATTEFFYVTNADAARTFTGKILVLP